MWGIAGASYVPGQPTINDRLKVKKRSDDGIRSHTKRQSNGYAKQKVDRGERKKVRTNT
jgi:hypothetical protein